jgi:tetratricopeptide (TPR) repeat protein
MHVDCRGLPLTAANADAVAAFDATVDAYLGFARDTGDRLKATLKADPAMPLAHVLRGSFFLLMGKPGLLAKAAEASAAANRALGSATAREQRHAAALAAWCKGDFGAALRQWEGILAEAPRDVVALKLAHYLHFYLGDAAAMRDSVERVLPGWDESLPGYAAVLGMRAFGLEESGAYAEAERTGRRAVELNPDDPWAVHAVAHVLEMQDRGRDGVAWIRGLERRWDACNNFRYHLWWHLALMHLGLGEAEAALALYDERVWDPASDEYLDLCNDAALLQRLELAGLDVGDRWAAVAAKARGQLAARILVFIDAHYALALAAAKDERAATELVGAVRACASDGAGTTAAVAAEVGADLCQGLLAYRAGDFGTAVERLAPLRAQLRRIGGSHAQRDLFTQILVDAATRAGHREVARAVLEERTAARPGQRFYRTRLAALGA